MDSVGLQVVVRSAGEVSAADRAYARAKVAHIARLAPGPVLAATLELQRSGDPAVTRPVTAKARFDVDGTLVRSHVAAATVREAADRLESRLRSQFGRLARRARDQHLRHRDEAWHRADPPRHRPAYYPRPRAEREIVRRKTYASQPTTAEAAVFEADLLDHDFFLFTDVDTGRDALVVRDDHHFEVVRPAGSEVPDGPVPTSAVGAPTLGLDDALARLDVEDAPFVFFVDPTTGRGRVAYRRYDGHYGLITPE